MAGHVRDYFFSSRRRHTRSLRDWSSDVCSSDLRSIFVSEVSPNALAETSETKIDLGGQPFHAEGYRIKDPGWRKYYQIGRASCRERVYNSVAAGSNKKEKII